MFCASRFIGLLCGLVIVLVLSISPFPASAEQVNVTLDDSSVLTGSTTTTKRSGRTIYQFLGIQYGQAPTRFMAPEEVELWNGTKDATSHGPACPQFMLSGTSGPRHAAANVDLALSAAAADRATQDESQCLILDVYSPNVSSSAKLPVLVYIHGGAFIGGSSSQIQPGYLLEYNLVLVAIQYRLGPLGFASWQTEDMPGNAGLADQVLALKWVQKYISQFGGDPNKVTVGGGSAGAASAGLLQLSPLTEGLFHQVFLESGSAPAPFALEDNPQARVRALADAANCTGINVTDSEMIECLRDAPLENLVTSFLWCAAEDMVSGGTGLGGALPVVQAPGIEERVLDQQPLDVMRSGSRAMPSLIGVSKHEGLYPLTILSIYKDLMLALTQGTFFIDKTVEDMVKRIMMIEENKVIAQAVAEKYFKPGTLASIEAMKPSLVDLTGAVYFKGPAVTSSKYNSKAGAETYLYSFNHQDKINYEGAGHNSDFLYLFPQPGYNLTQKEESVSGRMVHLLANFVISGNPTPSGEVVGVPQWQPFTQSDPFYMLADDIFQLRQDFDVQLTIAAAEGLRKRTSGATSSGVAVLALLLSVATATVQLL